MQPKALLDTCTALLEQVLQLQHPVDAVVSRFFRGQRQLGSRERSALAQTAYTVLRYKLRLEALARSGTGGRARRLVILAWAGKPEILQAALNPKEQAWLKDCQAITDEDSLWLPQHRHNLPDWLAQALQAQLGEQAFSALAASLLETAPLDVRVNAWKAKRPAVATALAEQGIEATPTPYSPWGLRLAGKPQLGKTAAFTEGLLEVQDEGSQLLALLLDAKRGEMVVDFCAGAGGKTLALGAQMRNTGRLYAFDTSAHRLDALKPRLARSGLSNVHPAAIAHERDERIKRLAGKIDRVLVDAPCSGLGTLRRNPDLKWRQTPQTVAAFNQQQAAILQSAARLLKPGGRLVYATCSLLASENEEIAQAFSAANPDFTPMPVAALLEGLKVEKAATLCSGGDDGQLYLRPWPHSHQMDGFFAAVWVKRV